MLINKETIPYRMGLQPFYYYQSAPPVKNERLGAYHPITPPYHHPYDFVLPMQSPPRSAVSAAAAAAAVAAAAGLPLPPPGESGSPRRTSSGSSSASSGSPLYFYLGGRAGPGSDRDDISSVPLSPPHTPPLRESGSPLGAMRSRPAPGPYGSLSGLSGAEPALTSGAASGTRNSVIMKVQNQQVVPMERDADADASSPSEPETVEEFICRWENCYCVFFKLEDLASHVTQKHAVIGLDGLYYCRWERCLRQDRGFNARYKMLVHVRTHTKEKPHQCGKCGKSFSRAENLKIHLRSHSGEKPYVCPVEGCNKAYSNSSDRFKHTRTHANDKPYVCKVAGCNKRYTDPSSLRKHVKTFKHPHHAQPLAADVYCMEYESCSLDSSGSGSPADFDADDIADELIDVVTLDGRCDAPDQPLYGADFERFHRLGEPCGHPDCDDVHESTGEPMLDESGEPIVDESDELDAEEDRPAVYATTAEAWPMPAVLNKIPPDSAAPAVAADTRRKDAEADAADEAPSIEDDELSSSVRRLNGRPKAARMLKLDVDGPLDLSLHHR